MRNIRCQGWVAALLLVFPSLLMLAVCVLAGLQILRMQAQYTALAEKCERANNLSLKQASKLNARIIELELHRSRVFGSSNSLREQLEKEDAIARVKAEVMKNEEHKRRVLAAQENAGPPPSAPGPK